MSRSPETTAPSAGASAWFDQARFGLFVHFGLYAIPARHEWSMTRERRSPEDYERYAELFDPDRFDARLIARTARAAGMRYAVLTTKHHEGFCLYDSALTEYTSVHACGRDLVREFVEALREEGLRVGFYHSLIDWHHPQFPIDSVHPLRDREDVAELNADRDIARYRAYLHGQVRELLTGYGEVDYLFFDFTYPGENGKGPEDWDSEGLLAMVRELQPGCVVNDRLGIPADLVTPEQYQPAEPMRDDQGELERWEACQTTNGSWGYDRDNLEFKSSDLLLRMLVDTVGKGGNMLLNIGPDGRGGLRREDTDSLADLGRWMDLHHDSVHGAGPVDPSSGIQAPPGTLMTQRGDRLYIHLTAWPLTHLHVRGLAGSVRFARLLNDGSEIAFSTLDPGRKGSHTTVDGISADTVTFTLPISRPDVLLPVLEVRLRAGTTGAGS
ncbi:alpha-L-fucosidase [Brachybacterium sacelli]|uniref:alpha-L-fucosidase n=1 Tax=Brachybacterium sacelli TaxID=173364 RepID=A0ABS4X2H7_9MICO|nr:alpha-L-fucosidase [Brachybacterium sacelli]MBP2382433.1 alpha-L-fucosidase [Brachybacterium sacelli]